MSDGRSFPGTAEPIDDTVEAFIRDRARRVHRRGTRALVVCLALLACSCLAGVPFLRGLRGDLAAPESSLDRLFSRHQEMIERQVEIARRDILRSVRREAGIAARIAGSLPDLMVRDLAGDMAARDDRLASRLEEELVPLFREATAVHAERMAEALLMEDTGEGDALLEQLFLEALKPHLAEMHGASSYGLFNWLLVLGNRIESLSNRDDLTPEEYFELHLIRSLSSLTRKP